MPALPDKPLIQRSWLTRGYFWPSPTWGLTAPALLRETQVTFRRTAPVPDGSGGFAGASTRSWTVWAHVELNDAESGVGGPLGTTGRRQYDVICAMPADTDDIPVKGDRLTFTDSQGFAVDLPVDYVTVPEGVPDHIEVTTSEFA